MDDLIEVTVRQRQLHDCDGTQCCDDVVVVMNKAHLPAFIAEAKVKYDEADSNYNMPDTETVLADLYAKGVWYESGKLENLHIFAATLKLWVPV